MKRLFSFLIISLLLGCTSDNPGDSNDPMDNPPGDLYFPPIEGTNWETVDTSGLDWNNAALQDLYNYLEDKNTKGFMILQDGKIAVENYFNGHNQNASWQWYSAVKSLTATAIGIAQDEGILDTNNKTSEYLGNNWSYLNQEQQDLITVKHHLSMSTGLEENIDQPLIWACTLPACLTYNSAPDSRWAYHQGAFTLLQDIISQNSGMDYKAYLRKRF